MAEWALKIGDSQTLDRYQGGDILCAFNRRYIRLCHADMICHPRVGGKKVGGQLGTTYPLLEKYLQRQHRYKWERVGRTAIKRTNLWVGGEIVYGSTPVEDPDRPGHMFYCRVEEHFAFRNKSRKLPLFGSAGAEIEYGDRMKRDAATTELIWDDIEAATPLRRVDHDSMPLGEESAPAVITLALLPGQAKRLRGLGVPEPFEIKYFDGNRKYSTAVEGSSVTAILGGGEARHFLRITVDEFDDAEAEELVAPLTDPAAITAENPEGIIKKRKHHVDWQADIAASLSNSATIADVEDRTTRVDIRAEETFVRADIQKTKSLV
jgi:hypothetical protein